MLKEGDKIPVDLKGILVDPNDIEKPTAGKTVSLKDLYKDRPLVLFFYPKDMTPGCTIEVQRFRDSFPEIQKYNVNLAGCSKDPEKSHCEFISKHGLNFPLISDPEGDILNAFGAWGQKKMYGKTFLGIQRSTFVINKGKILKAYPKVNVKKHSDEIIEYLKTLS